MSRWPDRTTRFWGSVAKSDGCWTWQRQHQRDGYPYGRFSFNVDRRRVTVQAHRYAWEVTYGPIPKGLCVCHHCDNPRCVRPDHLFVGTMADNVRDRDAKGRGRFVGPNRGERHYLAKLTTEQARDIYRRAIRGENQHAIAREYCIDPSCISDIKRRVQWKDATADLCHG